MPGSAAGFRVVLIPRGPSLCTYVPFCVVEKNVVSVDVRHTHANRHAADEQLLVKHAGEFSVHSWLWQQVLISKALTSAFVHCPAPFSSVFLAHCSQCFFSRCHGFLHRLGLGVPARTLERNADVGFRGQSV